MTIPSVPLATYRLQFNASFGFRDAVDILDYLRDIGITHVYASPVLTSRPGSGHGYDVTDPSRIDPDLGGEEAFAAFRTALKERGMGLLLDIVPNHMAASNENRWWTDVLEYGPDSPFASYFDINWRTPSRILENKILLPYLGKPFGDVLDSGELRVKYEDGRFLLQYWDRVFPIAPSSYAQILRLRAGESASSAANGSVASNEWQGITAAAESIASDGAPGTQAAAERRTTFERVRERLRALLSASPEYSAFLEEVLRTINGTVGDEGSFSMLERLLSAQHYRLAFWQTASDAINYRRFFSITDLVGVRVEDPSVFDATHDPIIRLAYEPGITGFRIDHIDGLRDPRGYLNRLRELLPRKKAKHDAAYLVVEKILSRNEFLPLDWPVDGTTGYDYLNFANRLLIDEHQVNTALDCYARWTESHASFDDLLYEKKKLVMRTLLGVEMRSLGRELTELASDDRYARELDAATLTEALIELTACLPVYRSYIQSFEIPEAAQKVLSCAIRSARIRRPTLPPACFDFVSDVLLLTPAQHVRPDQREARLAFVTRWQQFTGSIMAKGFEDTALYVYFPFTFLNEVGGDPRGFNADPLAFHEFISRRQEKWPHSINATTTHDTKRSEDARARIAVLSEIPADWERALREWSAMNERYVREVDGMTVPDPNEEYLFYQTLVGAWPLEEEEWASLVSRLQAYIVKATREAKVHTFWTHPNEPHESALCDFVAGVLDREHNSTFCSNFAQLQERTSLYGMLNGLGQALLKVACPGVPDCYQGSELWDFRLVDPDNRGPVDFAKRQSALNRLYGSDREPCSQQIRHLLDNWRDAHVKLHVLARSLNARRENPELFLHGNYQPLEIVGDHRDRAIAFARAHKGKWLIAVVPRCVAALNAPVVGDRAAFWQNTTLLLPNRVPANWNNILAGQSSSTLTSVEKGLRLSDVFSDFPVALLLPIPSGAAS